MRNEKWFINEDGIPYPYPVDTQVVDYPNDNHTAYDTKEDANNTFFIGPVEALDIACGNANVALSEKQLHDLADALVDIGADFGMEPSNA